MSWPPVPCFDRPQARGSGPAFQSVWSSLHPLCRCLRAIPCTCRPPQSPRESRRLQSLKKKVLLEHRISPPRAPRASGTFHLKGETGTGEQTKQKKERTQRHGGGGVLSHPRCPPPPLPPSYQPARGFLASCALTPKCQHSSL